MKLNKLLNIVITNFIIITNYSNAQVNIDFMPNGQFNINCDGRQYFFSNIRDLSNEINNITGDYFKIDSIRYHPFVYNTIVFHGLRNSSENMCNLILKSTEKYKPTIKLICGNSTVVFDSIFIEKSELHIATTTSNSKQSLLNCLSSITSEYFGFTSITRNNGILILNSFHSGNNNQFDISKEKTRIIINGENSPLVFDNFIVENIDAMEINSHLIGNKIPIEARTPVKIALNTPDSVISVIPVIQSRVTVLYYSNLADLESINTDNEYETEEDNAVQSTKLSEENKRSKCLKC